MSDDKNKNIDADLVRSLADILNDTDLTEIEVERGDLKIKVKREVTVAAAPIQYAAAPAPVAQAAPAAAAPLSMPSDPATIVARAGRRSLHQGRRQGEEGPDPGHRRSHEDHEPDPVAARRRRG